MTNVLDDQGAIEDRDEIFDYLDELAEHELNGRQIRNALLTASRLAESGRRKTRYKDLVQAIKQMSSFDRYLKQVYSGHEDDSEESRSAKALSIRADDWTGHRRWM